MPEVPKELTDRERILQIVTFCTALAGGCGSGRVQATSPEAPPPKPEYDEYPAMVSYDGDLDWKNNTALAIMTPEGVKKLICPNVPCDKEGFAFASYDEETLNSEDFDPSKPDDCVYIDEGCTECPEDKCGDPEPAEDFETDKQASPKECERSYDAPGCRPKWLDGPEVFEKGKWIFARGSHPLTHNEDVDFADQMATKDAVDKIGGAKDIDRWFEKDASGEGGVYHVLVVRSKD